jgi:hemolysin D
MQISDRKILFDIKTDIGRLPLQPGMGVLAELKTGRRRILNYLLSPVFQRINSAAQER